MNGLNLHPIQTTEERPSLEELKNFLANATNAWDPSTVVRRFNLGNEEFISCVYWNNAFFISGTDIVKVLLYRMGLVGKAVTNMKKFEEGIFSDLRNLKVGSHAVLEEPKSPFLNLLQRHGCIRTQKKQKVFFWTSVPHDKLFADALDREARRLSVDVHSYISGSGRSSVVNSPTTNRPLLPFLGSPTAAGSGVRKSHSMPMISSLLGRPSPSHANVTLDALIESSNAGVHKSISIDSGMGINATASGDHLLMPGGSEFPLDDKLMLDASNMGSSTLESLLGSQIVDFTGGMNGHKVNAHGSGVDSLFGSTEFTSMEYRSGSESNDDLASMSGMGLNMGFESGSASNVMLGGLSGSNVDLALRGPMEDLGVRSRRHSIVSTAQPYSRRQSIDEHGMGPGNGEERQYACEIPGCGYRFKRYEHLKRHLRTHTGEKPFVCPYEGCFRAFARSDNLTQHLRVHTGSRSAKTSRRASLVSGMPGMPGMPSPGTNANGGSGISSAALNSAILNMKPFELSGVHNTDYASSNPLAGSAEVDSGHNGSTVFSTNQDRLDELFSSQGNVLNLVEGGNRNFSASGNSSAASSIAAGGMFATSADPFMAFNENILD